jgi:Ca-activated chloride channel family protein
LLTQNVSKEATPLEEISNDLRFATAVASFGMLLKHSEHAGATSISLVRKLAMAATHDDPPHERLEFLELIDAAERLGIGG